MKIGFCFKEETIISLQSIKTDPIPAKFERPMSKINLQKSTHENQRTFENDGASLESGPFADLFNTQSGKRQWL